MGLVFSSLDKKRCTREHATFFIEVKKTSPIFVIFLNKNWIFFLKAKLLLLKSCKNKKRFQSDSINFKLFSTPSGRFLKDPELL